MIWFYSKTEEAFSDVPCMSPGDSTCTAPDNKLINVYMKTNVKKWFLQNVRHVKKRLLFE